MKKLICVLLLIVSAALAQIQTAGPTWLGTPTAGRTVLTRYQNNTGKTILVSATLQFAGTAPPMYLDAMVDLGPFPVTRVARAQNNTQTGITVSLFFPVLPGYYYSVVPLGGGFSSVAVTNWVEWMLP
jgi:hypothetical protein